MKQLDWTTEGSYITLKGVMDGEGAEALVATMVPEQIYTLDFEGVTDILFAGQRTLLRCRQKGQRLCIINADDNVAEKMEDSGVAVFINVCRKPKPLQMDKYKVFGASFMSKAYNSEDGDAMIKVYGAHGSLQMVAREKTMARAVMVFGLPTPLVGSIYSDGRKIALDFERIVGKRSLARIISEEPDRLEEIARKFSRMCKQLHETPCDTAVFPDRTAIYRELVPKCQDVSETVRQRMLAYLDTLPARTTCLHGDLHIGNVINDGKEDLWIDLGDFGYGNPMLDMGMMYFQMQVLPDEQIRSLYHIGKAETTRVWEIFLEEYFQAHTPEARQEVEKEVQKMCAVHMAYLATIGGLFQFMIDFINREFGGEA